MGDGKPRRGRRKTVWIVLAVLTLLCCGVPGSVGGFFIREAQIDKQEEILKVRDDDPIEVRDVYDLLKAYAADKAGAEAKYDRRVLRMKGKVLEISKKHVKISRDSACVCICHFDDPRVPASLVVGNDVTVKGFFPGMPFWVGMTSRIELRHCQLISEK